MLETRLVGVLGEQLLDRALVRLLGESSELTFEVLLRRDRIRQIPLDHLDRRLLCHASLLTHMTPTGFTSESAHLSRAWFPDRPGSKRARTKRSQRWGRSRGVTPDGWWADACR